MDFENISRSLDVQARPSEIPHDIAEPEYNKFHPNVVRYLPLQYRCPKLDFKYIQPGIDEHRKSLHHVLGNGDGINPDASYKDRIRNEIDSFSAIRSHRKYIDQVSNLEEIRKVFLRGRPPEYKPQPKHKIEAFDYVLEKIKQIGLGEMPKFGLRDFIQQDGFLPNAFGLPNSIYEEIVKRTRRAFEMIRSGEYRAIWEREN